MHVAPHAGSVDRNLHCRPRFSKLRRSLPTRGAWIEISAEKEIGKRWKVAPHAGSVDRNHLLFSHSILHLVAPHAGSVDRNNMEKVFEQSKQESLPTRGAWIEISTCSSVADRRIVAPHAGSVDRNFNSGVRCSFAFSRSPRGERG